MVKWKGGGGEAREEGGGAQQNVTIQLAECSLVPRPSQAPVFDRLQYAKTEPES